MGFGYDRPWRMKTWDKHAVPRPYSRARAVVSPAVQVPAELDRAGLEHYRLQVERLLNRLTLEAEAWAESGTRKTEEVPLRREPIWRGYARLDKPEGLAGPHFFMSPAAQLTRIRRDSCQLTACCLNHAQQLNPLPIRHDSAESSRRFCD